MRRPVLGGVIDEVDRAPEPIRLFAHPGHERVLAEVVGQPGGVSEHLSRRGLREVFPHAPALQQVGGKLTGERLVQRQPPVRGQVKRNHSGHVLCRAGDSEGIVGAQRPALPAAQPAGRAVPAQPDGRRFQPSDGSWRAAPDLRIKRTLQTNSGAGLTERCAPSQILIPPGGMLIRQATALEER